MVRLTLLAPLALTVPLLAQAVEPAPAGGCVTAEVNGYKSLSYECLNQQLANPEGAEATRRNQAAMNVPVNQRAPNQIGLFNQSATQIRMGNAFGNSVTPQRPSQ